LAPLVCRQEDPLRSPVCTSAEPSAVAAIRDTSAWFLSCAHLSQLNIHPHVHCVVLPAASGSITHWVRCGTFLPKRCWKVFAANVDAWRFQNGQLNFRETETLAQQTLAARLRHLSTSLGGYLRVPWWSEYVLHYLGRYTIKKYLNHRLADLPIIIFVGAFADHNKQKLLTLPVDEFLRRFLLHLLPEGFVCIRNFGFLANRKRATLLPLCFQLFGAVQEPQAEQHASSTEDFPDLWRCPQCGGPMKIIERLTASEIQLRSPPGIMAAA
jgi:hypothetical protein